MKKKIIIVVTLFTVGVISVWILFVFSYNFNHQSNNFIRIFPPHLITQSQTFDLKYNSYYIAGSTSKSIYLGNFTAPFHIIKTNFALSDTQHIKINSIQLKQFKFRSIRVAVDSPDFFLMDGIMPGLFKGNVTDWIAMKYMFDSAYFTASVPISPNSFALRVHNIKSNQYDLAKETSLVPNFTIFPGLIQKQIDGTFCTDGMLHFNKRLSKLVYLYYYRNEFICTDTNLNLLYRGKTIDTVSRAQIKVSKIEKENALTFSSPPLTVNKKSCTSGEWLFVQSGLLAKNENEDMFRRASVIDVYNLNTGTYKLSFYLLDIDGHKMRDFFINGSDVVALYDNKIVSFKISSKYLQDNVM